MNVLPLRRKTIDWWHAWLLTASLTTVDEVEQPKTPHEWKKPLCGYSYNLNDNNKCLRHKLYEPKNPTKTITKLYKPKHKTKTITNYTVTVDVRVSSGPRTRSQQAVYVASRVRHKTAIGYMWGQTWVRLHNDHVRNLICSVPACWQTSIGSFRLCFVGFRKYHLRKIYRLKWLVGREFYTNEWHHYRERKL